MVTFKIYTTDPSYKYPVSAQEHTDSAGFNTVFKSLKGIKRSINAFWNSDNSDYIAHILKGEDGQCTADIEQVI